MSVNRVSQWLSVEEFNKITESCDGCFCTSTILVDDNVKICCNYALNPGESPIDWRCHEHIINDETRLCFKGKQIVDWKKMCWCSIEEYCDRLNRGLKPCGFMKSDESGNIKVCYVVRVDRHCYNHFDIYSYFSDKSKRYPVNSKWKVDPFKDQRKWLSLEEHSQKAGGNHNLCGWIRKDMKICCSDYKLKRIDNVGRRCPFHCGRFKDYEGHDYSDLYKAILDGNGLLTMIPK